MPDAPKSITGYLVENADWEPPAMTPRSWKYMLPALIADIRDARAECAGFQAMAADGPKVILQATVTFRVVEGGEDG